MPVQLQTSLVVDCVPTSRNMLCGLLTELGVKRVDVAESDAEAFDTLIAKQDIECVISEWQQARLDGSKLLRRIRSIDRFRDLPVIIVTSKAIAGQVALAVDLEVTNYLVKPVTLPKLQEKLRGLSQDSPRCVLGRAKAEAGTLENQGDLERAEEVLRRVADNYPTILPRVQFEIASMLARSRRPEPALELLEEALQASPQMGMGWKLKAGLLLAMGRDIEADDAMSRALSISPDNPEYHLEQGVIHLSCGRMEKAKWCFMRCLNFSPDDDQLILKVYNAYARQGLTDLALKEFQSLMLQKLSADALNRLGLSLRKQGKVEQAIDIYKQALFRFPEDSTIHYNLAIALLRNDQRNASLYSLQRALQIDPEFDKARTLLQELAEQGST